MFRRNVWRIHEKNKKNLEFFWFFAFLQLRLPSKNKKKTRFFLVFKNLNQKKNKKLKENQKKTSFDLKPKLLQKVLVFWFFGFLEDSSHIGRTLPLLVKLVCFNFFFLIQEKTMWRNLEKTKKTKNQNFLEKFWLQVKRLFFLVFLEFFVFFGLDS